MTRCWLSETHIAVSPFGLVRPCCRFHTDDNYPLNISGKTIKEVFESDFLQNVRDDLKSGIKHKGCNKCWYHESKEITSMREQYNMGRDFENLSQLNSYEKIHSIEISFSNHCNYRCRHCNSFCSSKWREDDLLLGNRVPDTLLEPNLDDLEIHKLVNLEHIKMLGGEPLLSKNHEKLIKSIEHNIHNINLEYVTNGSLWPKDEIVEIWKRAKTLRLIISLDDVYEYFEYFRTDSSFNTVEDTFAKIEHLRTTVGASVTPNIHCVINALNLYRIDQIVEYMIEHLPEWNFTFDNIAQPDYLHIRQWSKSQAKNQIKKLENIDNSISVDSKVNRHKKRNIKKAIKIIKDSCTAEINDFTKLFSTNNILDKSRKTDIHSTHQYIISQHGK
jgi:radical SAM protein with 4Fe4S-binding SPASM domain